MGTSLRCVYCDLDGTLLGRQGSFFNDLEGNPTLLGARAIELCQRSDVEFVIYSGRGKTTVRALTRLLGQRSYIYEAGCAVVVDEEEEFLTDELVERDGVNIHDQITSMGAPKLLLQRYLGKLEYHSPWHEGRTISHLFRGSVDVSEVDVLLEEHGLGTLRLIDNGAIFRHSPTLEIEGLARVYHLAPRSASKRRAVQRHMQIRGYMPAECIAIGDSNEDLGAATAVGTFWAMENGVKRDAAFAELVRSAPNIRVTDGEAGAGVYDAIITELAERRKGDAA